jgi:signal transduction histidine kinase
MGIGSVLVSGSTSAAAQTQTSVHPERYKMRVRDEPTLGVRPDSAPMVWALGVLYLVGPSLAALTLVLPRSPQVDATPIWLAIASVYALAPIVFTQYRRLPPWAISATIAFTNLAISVGIYCNHEGTSPYAWFYLWVTPYTAVFFPRWQVAAHVGAIGVAYGVLLSVHADDGHGVPGGAEVSQWVQTMGALLVTVLLVRALSRALRENLDRIEEERRRRALEINDDVVQRLVIARQCYAAGDRDEGDQAVEAALERARRIMAELIESGQLQPGHLRRDVRATLADD